MAEEDCLGDNVTYPPSAVLNTEHWHLSSYAFCYTVLFSIYQPNLFSFTCVPKRNYLSFHWQISKSDALGQALRTT